MNSAGSPESAAVKQPLDDVMLAMDVVDTLRRRERLVKKELDEAGRQEDLKERLRKIYAAQGIDVPDHIIERGIQALKEERFTYKPPPDNFTTRLARLYVRRSQWGKWVLGGLAVPIVAWTINFFTAVLPDAGLPDDLQSIHAEVVELAESDHARQTAGIYLTAGQAALGREDTGKARVAIADLESMRSSLAQEYTIRIVNRPGIRSGVWRIPDVNSSARNYYIIVEAIDLSGNTLDVPVLNEETGKTMTVELWGQRVDKEVFERVAADKQNDGIIEKDRFGYKERGYLIPRFDIPTSGGAITKW